MQIKTCYIKILFKFIVIITIFESLYLFAFPFFLEKFLTGNILKSFISNNSNIILTYDNPKIKTHFNPKITLSFYNINIIDKLNNNVFLDGKNLSANVYIFPLFFSKLKLENINAENLLLNIKRDNNGVFNFEQFFAKKNKNKFNICISNSSLLIENYQLTFDDKLLNKESSLEGSPLFIKNTKKNNNILIKTKSIYKIENDITDIDINLEGKYPFKFKNFNNELKGNCFIYNLNLSPLLPYAQEFFNKNISNLEGFIEFIQFSAEKNEDNKNHFILNSNFDNIVFDIKDWKNHIIMSGDNQLSMDINLYNKIVDINSLNFKAKNINIKGNGLIDISKKPDLDLKIEVSDSKAENIASILPPNLVKQNMIIEKVKSYGVFGDIEAKLCVKGKIPQPDITGYVRAENVHVLEKSIHNLHKGTVNINFDKRILNMDILVDMFDKQKAQIKGYVYMFRDGINNVSVKTTDNVDFPLAQKIVVPVSKVFNFQLGPIPDMNIMSGKGKVDVNIKGSIDFVNIDGFSFFNNARLTYNGLFGEIYNAKGRLDFKDDIISFKSEKAFVKNHELDVNGKVQINKNLNFNIMSNYVEAENLLEIINKSELLKDVKEGIAIINNASGPVKIAVNMKAKIVPVPFGHPPLPPEEAFEDLKVKGSLYLFGNSCYIEGFKTPIKNLKGIADFTETVVDLNNIDGISGSSPIRISGKIVTDVNTKIPDVDIEITSDGVYLKDTIKFLTQSYLYPENYPDISLLYNIDSKHDLYFKYKAKSVDFLTDKAYAVMNFINDNEKSSLKAISGSVVMDKAVVYVNDVKALLFDSVVNIKGNVQKIDTLNPIYNLTVNAENFNMKNLNNANKLAIMPEQFKNVFSQFYNFSGNANVDISVKKNTLSGNIDVVKTQFKHIKSNLPVILDDFTVKLNNNKITLNNLTAQIEDMPFYANISINNIFKKADINAYFTSKITNNLIRDFFSKEIAEKISVTGDINFSAQITGTDENLNIKPVLTLYPQADVLINGVSFGEISDKREFEGNINVKNKSFIIINKLDYIKYISSQDNIMYPMVFATLDGVLNLNKDNIIEPVNLHVKTNKNISAKVLNVFLKRPVLTQGTFSCNLKYNFDKLKKSAKLIGDMECRNIDIPLFDTLIKHIKIKADNNDIDLNLFGFISDSKININSLFENNLYEKLKVRSLKINADEINHDKLFQSLSKTHIAIKNNNEIKNVDFSGVNIENGFLSIKKLAVKSLVADNVTSAFSINENGLFCAKDIKLNVGNGNIQGNIDYDLMSSKFKGDFELNNVDANYVAETLFDGKNQIYGNANGKLLIETSGYTNEEMVKNLSGFILFDINDGRMPKLGSLEYLLRASNIIKSGITGFTINSILELLNLVKTGYFSTINGSCIIDKGIAKNIEIYSKGENLSLYIHGSYDISKTSADMEILGKLSRRISTILGSVGNTSLNTFFKLIPGISMLDFGRKDFIEDVEKIPSFTNGDYESRIFQAIINGNINDSGYVQSFKWVK